MAATTQPWYLEERAEALAILYLTRREDLLVRRQRAEDGIDLLVEIRRGGQSSGRLFGLLLEAQVSAMNENAHQKGQPLEDKLSERAERFPFPVCMFFFTMSNDEGYFQWVSEPFITEEGQPKLRTNTTDPLKKFTSEAFDHLIHRVNRWYDSLSTALAA